MTKKLIPTQTDLEPTETERHKIMADLVARNAERTAQGLPEYDVALMSKGEFARYRVMAYRDLRGPYLKVCLQDIQNAGGPRPSPADYLGAVTKAEAQLEEATGIVSPKFTMASGGADVARYRH